MKINNILLILALVEGGRKKGNKKNKNKTKCAPACNEKFTICNPVSSTCECAPQFQALNINGTSLNCVPQTETGSGLLLADEVQQIIESLVTSLFTTIVDNPKRRNKVI